jgi:dTDP-4-dehydrorhamnose 3,5-epimerase
MSFPDPASIGRLEADGGFRSFMTRPATCGSGAAIRGVEVRRLVSHADDRGTFTEIFRETWLPAPRFVQWNAVTSRAGTLRGVHVHRHHDDYLVLVSGHLWLGLADLRPDDRPVGERALIEIVTAEPTAVTIPRGVAHGFLFSTDSVHVYAVSEYFDGSDELGCRWDDPVLELAWPIIPSYVSGRDQQLPSLQALRAALAG